MKYPRFLLACLGLLAALWAGAVQALPTVDQVQAAAQRGDYVSAEKMMREVVAARPDSARAHYVLAELLAHQRQFNEAAEHTRRARSLDPAIKFTDPAKFKAFEQLLQREQIAAARPAAPPPLEATATPPQQRAAPATAGESSSGGVPVWMLVAGALVFIAVAASWMRRRAAA
jgi:tetratricopeptide (TPR) repeat protein